MSSDSASRPPAASDDWDDLPLAPGDDDWDAAVRPEAPEAGTPASPDSPDSSEDPFNEAALEDLPEDIPEISEIHEDILEGLPEDVPEIPEDPSDGLPEPVRAGASDSDGRGGTPGTDAAAKSSVPPGLLLKARPPKKARDPDADTMDLQEQPDDAPGGGDSALPPVDGGLGSLSEPGDHEAAGLAGGSDEPDEVEAAAADGDASEDSSGGGRPGEAGSADDASAGAGGAGEDSGEGAAGGGDIDDVPTGESGKPRGGDSGERDGSLAGRARPPVKSDETDQGRADFLKSLMDGGSDAVPQKVELDLDGIFDQAKKEAENLSPDATRQPVEAPKPDEVKEEEPADDIDVAPLNVGAQFKKVARVKMFILLGTLAVVAVGLLFAVYSIFIKGRQAPPPPPPPIAADPIDVPRELTPGERPLGPFFLIMNEAEPAKVLEMQVILHYRDEVDAPLIEVSKAEISNQIFLYAKAEGQELLTDMDKRTAFQARMLEVLNALPSLRSDPLNPRLTYLQISMLRLR
ncbi:MAG: hypothetical protein LBO05_10580 [Deltaproteobacteria bacterium]|nr:hypothetical protein [Deltaproteobacteria bacterium]